MKSSRFATILVGFGLTGQFVYPTLRQKFGNDLLILDPYPVSDFYRESSDKKSLPFDPEKEAASRSQRFGRWSDGRANLAFFEGHGLRFRRDLVTNAFASLANDSQFSSRVVMTEFPWQTQARVTPESVVSLRPQNGGVCVDTAAGSYQAQRVILTMPPQDVWRCLQSFQPELATAHAQADEHAVRSLLVFSPHPPQSEPQRGFYGPVDLGAGIGCGVECIGPLPWSALTEASRESLAKLGYVAKSYRMLHFFLSGPFVTLANGKRHWYLNLPHPKRVDDFIASFLKQIAEPGDEAILLRDFSADPGVFHQASLKSQLPLFDQNGILHGAPQIQILGSSLLPRLRGVHPTLEVLSSSFNALMCNR